MDCTVLVAAPGDASLPPATCRLPQRVGSPQPWHGLSRATRPRHPMHHYPTALRPSSTTTRTPLVGATTSPENPPCDASPASAHARRQMARHASEYVHESGRPETGAYHEQHTRLLHLAPAQIVEPGHDPVASPSRAAEAKRCCKLDASHSAMREWCLHHWRAEHMWSAARVWLSMRIRRARRRPARVAVRLERTE